MPRVQKRINNKLLSAAALGVLLIAVLLLELTNTTHLFHKQKVPAIIPAHTNSGASINSEQSKQPTGSSNPTQNNTPLPDDASKHTLIAPSGTFVSNHFPGKDNTPTTESSTCDTSPGATCYIKFTNIATGEATQLPTQTADARGSTSWYWDIIKDARLTSGQWRVTAIASLGTQVKTSSDTLNLTIQ